MHVNSSTVDWHVNRVETFVIFRTEYSVTQAKEMIKKAPRPVNYMLTQDLKFVSAWPTIYREIREKADLSIPIIMAKVGRGYMPIDGWHRIHKALRTKEEKIPFVALTSAESKEIQF